MSQEQKIHIRKGKHIVPKRYVENYHNKIHDLQKKYEITILNKYRDRHLSS